MSIYHLEYLSRDSYEDSIKKIEDIKTVNFANMSLKWWDKKLGWYTKGCAALTDVENNHLSYIFYKIDRYNKYITIHIIFTPLSKRRNGHANLLLDMVFDFALLQHVSRFRMASVSKSLDFYLSMGFVYWGVNSVGDYYCDLPIPHDGLNGIKKMIQSKTIPELIGKQFDVIYKKIENNNIRLTVEQKLIYNADLVKLNTSYLLDELLSIEKNVISI